MVKYIVVAILVVCAWVYWGKQKAESVRKQMDERAVHDMQNMQSNVQRAEDAAAKANTLIKQQEADAKKAMTQAESSQ